MAEEEPVIKPFSPEEKESLNHAWNWFTVHAAQRMQCVNYFLVAMAFMSTAYVTALSSGHHWAACVVGGVAAWFSICFNRLEHRTKGLVKAAEAALLPLQHRLASTTGISHLEIVKGVEATKPFGSYSKVINALQLSAIGVFSLGAIVALLLATKVI